MTVRGWRREKPLAWLCSPRFAAHPRQRQRQHVGQGPAAFAVHPAAALPWRTARVLEPSSSTP